MSIDDIRYNQREEADTIAKAFVVLESWFNSTIEKTEHFDPTKRLPYLKYFERRIIEEIDKLEKKLRGEDDY